MKATLKALPKPVVYYGLPALVLIVIAVIAWQPLQVLNLQARAGKGIDAYIQTHAGQYGDFFTCQIPALTRMPEDGALDEAMSLLERARQARPKAPQTYLLLGKAYCLQGDFFGAMSAFDVFSQLRQGNPLGELETGFAHFTRSLVTPELGDVERAAHEAQSREIFVAQGYSYDYFIAEADAAFSRDAYPVAWYWYRLAGSYQPLPEEALTRVEFLDALFLE